MPYDTLNEYQKQLYVNYLALDTSRFSNQLPFEVSSLLNEIFPILLNQQLQYVC